MSGVGPTGFDRKTYATIREEILDAIEANISIEMRQAAENDNAALNKLVCIFAEREGDLWELAESVYNATYPATSDGAALDNVAQITGTTRIGATHSTVQEVCEGTIGITIPLGSKVETATQGDEFETLAALTLDASVSTKAYVDLNGAAATGTYTVTLNGTPFGYAATVPPDDETAILDTNLKALINAGAEPVTAVYTGGQLVITADTDADGIPIAFTITVTANLTIAEVANLVAMQSVETGPIVAYASNLSVIVSAVSGWSRCGNPIAADLGVNEETDAELRDRRAASQANPGSGTVDAIRAAVLEVTGVTACFVINNPTDAVDGDGVPAHSIAVVALGGDTDDIAEAIWDHLSGGIYTHGSVTETIVDDQGFQQSVRFSRPTEIPYWIRLTYTEDTESPDPLPDDADAQVAAAALSWGDAYTIGHDVLPHQCMAAILASVAGIRTLLVEIAIDSGGSPGAYQTTPSVIGALELATFAAGRIVVV